MNIPTLISRTFLKISDKDYYSIDFYNSIISLISYGIYSNRISQAQLQTDDKMFLAIPRYDVNDNRIPDAKYLKIKNVKSKFFNTIKWYYLYNKNLSYRIDTLEETELDKLIQKIDSYVYLSTEKQSKYYINYKFSPLYHYNRIFQFYPDNSFQHFNTEYKLFIYNLLYKAYELACDINVINGWICIAEYNQISDISKLKIHVHLKQINSLKLKLELLLDNL